MIYYFTKMLFFLYFKIFFQLQVYGKENITQGKCIVAPNHASFFDPPIIAASWPTPLNFLARKSLFKNKFSQWLLEKLHTYPVGGTSEDLNSIKFVSKLLKKGDSLAIFPEGARSEDGELQPIKTGIGMIALRNHVDIIPTYIKGSFEIWPKNQKWPSFTGKITVIFGKPIYWKDYQNMPRKEAYEAIAHQTSLAMQNLKNNNFC